MAEAAPVVHIGENSPQQIAYKLLLLIAAKEGKLLDEPSGGGHATADRKWLLDTYAECLRTVQNPSRRKSHMSARSFKVRLAKAGAGDHTAGGLR
jgi:hypothetical protein